MARKLLKAGLIGANISKTRFPAALNLMCAEAGIDLSFDLIDSADQAAFDFFETVAAFRAQGWTGVSVTHPFKSMAATLLPDKGKGLGAVNILLFDGDGLRGANTDYTGFIAAWQAEMGDQRPGRVAMAGAGGVARALVPALVKLGASDIAIWDKDHARAVAIANQIGGCCRAVSGDDIAAAIADADGLVNATYLGMTGHPTSAFANPLPGPPAWVFDAVYTPVETPFLISARAAGAKCVSGFALFQHMAIRSFQIYTGVDLDPDQTLAKLAMLKP